MAVARFKMAGAYRRFAVSSFIIAVKWIEIAIESIEICVETFRKLTARVRIPAAYSGFAIARNSSATKRCILVVVTIEKVIGFVVLA